MLPRFRLAFPLLAFTLFFGAPSIAGPEALFKLLQAAAKASKSAAGAAKSAGTAAKGAATAGSATKAAATAGGAAKAAGAAGVAVSLDEAANGAAVAGHAAKAAAETGEGASAVSKVNPAKAEKVVKAPAVPPASKTVVATARSSKVSKAKPKPKSTTQKMVDLADNANNAASLVGGNNNDKDHK